jgi:cell division protein FtsL
MEITKKTNLIATLKKAGIIYLVTLVIFTGLFLFSNNKAQVYLDNISFSEQQISSTNSQLSELENKIKEIKEASKILEKLNKRGGKHNGLEIDDFQSILNDLRKHYQISDKIDINMSSPTIVDGIYKKSTTTIVSSTITLNVSGISDEILLQFVDSLLKNAPGFISVESLEMTKKYSLTQDVITKVTKGDLTNLVEAKIVFSWKDFKDL